MSDVWARAQQVSDPTITYPGRARRLVDNTDVWARAAPVEGGLSVVPTDTWQVSRTYMRYDAYHTLMDLAKIGTETDPAARAAEEAKIQVSYFLADQMNLEPKTVYGSFNSSGYSPIAEEYFKVADLPISYKQQVKNEITRAAKTYQALNIATELMFSAYDPAKYDLLQQTLDSIPREEGPPARRLGQGGLWDLFKGIPLAAIQQSPYLMEMGVAELVGAAVGGGIAAFAGPQAVPAGIVFGRRVAGFLAGTRLGAASIFMDILTMIDPETGEPLYKVVRDKEGLANIARVCAAMFGGISGAINMLQFETLLGANAVKKMAQSIGLGAVEKAGRSGAIRSAFLTFIKKYGVNVAFQTLSEPVQEIMELVGRDVATDAINGKFGTELQKANWKDYVDLALRTADMTFRSSLLFALPGSIKEARAAVGETFREAGTKEASRKLEALDKMSDQARPPAERIKEVAGRLDELRAAQKKLELENPQILDLTGVKKIDKKLGDLIKEHQRNTTEVQYLNLLRQETEAAMPQPWKQTREEWQRSAPSTETTAVETPAVIELRSPVVDQIRSGLPNLSPEQAQGAALYAKLHADTVGTSLEDYMSSRFIKDIFDPTMAAELERQGRWGGMRWDEAGKAIFMTTTQSNFSTWVHELNHLFARELSAEERTSAEGWLGVKHGMPWSTKQQEVFANAGLAYVMSGHSPSEELRPIFQRFSGWVDEVYHSVKDQWPVTEDIRRTYEGILAGRRKAEAPAPAAAVELFQTPAMHGTAFDFEQFSLERAGTGEGTAQFGEGVYLTSREGVARYYADYVARRRGGAARQVLKTEISRDNFLSWYDGPTDAQRKQILEGAIKESIFADRENKGYLVERFKQAVRDGSGEDIYRYLSIALGDEKGASAFLQRSGIDGFTYPVGTVMGGNLAKSTERGMNYVVFDPGNISIKERMLFQTPPVAEEDLKYEGWRLKSVDVIRAKMTGPMPAENARKMLLNAGVSPEEMKWMGLDEVLAKGGKITPEQLLQAIRENGIQVVEVVKGDSSQRDLEQAEAEFMRIATRDGVDPGDARDIGLDAPHGQLTAQQQDLLTPEARTALDELKRAYKRRGEVPVGEQTKYGRPELTLPGGEEYRELLLRLPPGEVQPTDLPLGWVVMKDHIGEGWTVYDDESEPQISGATKQEALQNAHEFALKMREPIQAKGDFVSPHWKERNVLAHVRFDDRSDAAGSRVLFIEEMQSDWHQAGREKGYKGEVPAYSPEALTMIDQLRVLGITKPASEIGGRDIRQAGGSSELAQRWFTAMIVGELTPLDIYAVPQAPFKKSWPELSFKRMLRWAAENDYDQLAWTTGEQQAKRYDLSKQVDGISIRKEADGSFSILADKQGEPLIESGARDAGDLAGIVGKDLAAKAEALQVGQEERFTGQNLVVGGAGMRAFYDKIVVDFANKIGKKWGVKTGTTDVEQAGPVHSMAITDEMRQGVERGLYLFQTPPKVTDEIDQRRLNKAMGDFWGFTEDPRYGAFILSTGQMLDFYHKRIGQTETVMEGGRPVHRGIPLPYEGLFKTERLSEEFMDRAGAIRMAYDPDVTILNSIRQPSEEQLARIASILPKTRALDLEVSDSEGVSLGYKRIEYPSADHVRAFYNAFDLYSPRGILAQPSPHEEAVQRAVKIGDPVPRKVLEQYQSQDWAKEEIARRGSLVDEARKAATFEDFADWIARAEPDRAASDPYYRMIWDQAQRPVDPDVQAARFTAAMDDATIKDVLAEIEFTEGDLEVVPARVLELTPEMRELGKKLLNNEQDDALLATVRGQIQGEADRWRRVLTIEDPEDPTRAASAIQTAEAQAEEPAFQPITARQANTRFIKQMEAGGLANFAADLYERQISRFHQAGKTKEQKFSLPRWIAVLGKQASDGVPDQLTERMALKELRREPTVYREMFAAFYHEEDMIRQLEHEKATGDVAEDERLRTENLRLRGQVSKWKEELAAIQKQVDWQGHPDDRIADLNRTLEEQRQTAETAKEELRLAQVKAEELQRALEGHRGGEVEKSYRQQIQLLEGLVEKQRNQQQAIMANQFRRDRMEKLIREIHRPGDPYIADAEQRMIEDIQSRITYDPGDAEGGMLNRLREWRRQNPNAEMPPELVMQIEARSPRLMTFSELDQIARRVRDLRRQGRQKRMQELFFERAMVTAQKSNAIMQVRKGEPPAEVKGLGTAGARKVYKTGALKVGLWGTWRMNRIADMLGPTFTRWLWDEVNDATDATLSEIRKVDRAAVEKLKALGIGPRELGRTETIDGIEFTRAEMIGLYIYSQDLKTYAAIRWGNRIPDETIRAAIQKLTPQEKEYSDWMVSTLSSDADFDRLQAAQIEFNNTRMQRVARYFPMQRRGIAGGMFLKDIAQELLEMRGYSRRPRARSGFLISRIDIAPGNQTPVRLDAPAVFHDHVNKREFFINNATLIKRLSRIFDNREVTQALLDRYGDAMPKLINNYTTAYTNPNIYRAVEDWGDFGRILRANYGLALIGSNVLTMLRQVPDIPMIMLQAGPIDGIVAAAQFARNPAKAIRNVQEKAPQLALRSYDRVIEEMKLLDKTGWERGVRRFGEAGFAVLKAMDTTTNTIGWLAMYNKTMRRTGNEQLAVKAARDFILAKRPAARAKDLAQLWREPGIMSWLTMFTNQPNQQWNVLTYDIPHKLASGLRGNWRDLGEAVMNATALMIGAVGMGMIARKSIGGIRDWGKDTVAGILGNVPFIGYDIENAIRGQGPRGGFEPISGAGEVAKAITDIAGGAEKEKVVREVMNAFWGLSQTIGLPAIQMRRFYRTAESMLEDGAQAEDLWQLVGGPPKKEN